jgi:hypothetical protein
METEGLRQWSHGNSTVDIQTQEVLEPTVNQKKLMFLNLPSNSPVALVKVHIRQVSPPETMIHVFWNLYID